MVDKDCDPGDQDTTGDEIDKPPEDCEGPFA